MAADRARVLVQGATGYTGRLVCTALSRRGLPFAAGGRSPGKLAALAADFGCETVVVDARDDTAIARALEGRTVVLACAGPFAEVGEPMVAGAARAGVHYADTTGEQPFVERMLDRYDEAAKSSGACIAPAMAYEIAPGDWAAHLAAEDAGGPPDSLDIVYMLRPRYGYAAATTRGTKRSALAMIASGESKQYVDGALRHELPAEVVRTFDPPWRVPVTAVSFPSPESVVVAQHTGARTVRTFMAVGKGTAAVIRATRHATPWAVRALRPFLSRFIEESSEGPTEDERKIGFDVRAEAHRGPVTTVASLSGMDPYGLTAEIQALFAAHALEGKLTARGVVAPSMAIAPYRALEALASVGFGLSTFP